VNRLKRVNSRVASGASSVFELVGGRAQENRRLAKANRLMNEYLFRAAYALRRFSNATPPNASKLIVAGSGTLT
jgi:hypothetical protein